jgi:hypothetical protein
MAIFELLTYVISIFMTGTLAPDTNSTPTSTLDKNRATFNSVESSRRKSWVWMYFKLSDCKKFVKCDLCKSMLNYCGTTSTMSNHLNNCKL